MGDINNSTNDNENSNLNNTNEFIDSTDTNDASNTQDADLNEESVGSNLSTEENSDSTDTPVNTETYSNMNPADYSQTQNTPNYIDMPRKKVSGKSIALLIALVVVLVGAITTFANRNALANTISRMTKSPAEYYSYVEQKGLDSSIDKFTSAYDKALTTYDEQITKGAGQELNLKFTLNPEFSSMLGVSAGNFESIEAFISSFGKEGSSKSSVALSYNGTSLISSDMYLNSDTSDLILAIPELSSAYLLFSFDEIMTASGAYPDGFSYSEYTKDFQKLLKEDSLSPDTLNKLLKKYSSLIVNNIKNVTVEKTSDFTASDISNSFTTIRAEISDEDIYNIGMTILNEAKNDKVLKDLCKTLDICTEEEYNRAIEDSISNLNADKESYTSDNSIVMNVYVDKNGKVMGREFKPLGEEDTSLGYYSTKKGNDFGFTFWFTEGGAKEFDISGKATKKGETYDGTCTISIEDATTTLDIAFENAGMVGDKGYFNGTYTISSNEVPGMKIIFDCIADQKQQQVIIKLMYAGMEAATFDITGKEVDYKDFSFPSDSEQIYDGLTDMNAYLETVDFESFIAKLEGTLGIEDLDSYLQYLLPGLAY